jgi:RNA polymerase sigma-70 factor (ECF subfamily)
MNQSPPSSGTSSGTPGSLLERVRAGEPAAWEALVTLYAPLVYHWCRRWHLQEQDTADILQEVFHAVVTHIADFRRSRRGDTFRGWLRTIVRNKVHDHFRRLGREPGGVGGTDAQQRLAQLPEPEPSEVIPDDGEAERRLFHRCLELIRGEFEERTWQAFWRTAVDGRSPKDVGDDLGMTPGAVRVAKCRVLQRLREALGDVLD